MDQDVDGVALDFITPSVNSFLDLRSRQDAAWPLYERVHEGVFAGGQDGRLAPVGQLVGLGVKLGPACDQPRGGMARPAAYQRSHARQQLARFERLEQIIVCAEIVPRHANGMRILLVEDDAMIGEGPDREES